MDTGALTLLFVFAGIPTLAFGVPYLIKRYYNRKKLETLDSPFKPEWEKIIEVNVPIVSKLPIKFRQRLRDNLKLFIAETNFEGKGGVIIDDEIRVTVATQACLLTVGRKDKRYPKLKSVIVYPSAFTDGKNSPRGSGSEGEPIYRLGESWTTGTVVLAWDSAKRGALNMHDGQNVTLHEFAHQLDQEDGIGDGAPIFESQSAFSVFSSVFAEEYQTQVEKAAKKQRSVLDHYGATNYAEFFAVGTESFFEKPKQLLRKRPELYQLFKDYYRLDPVSWK